MMLESLLLLRSAKTGSDDSILKLHRSVRRRGMPQGAYPFCFRFLSAHAARPVRHSLLISQGDRFAATGDLAGHKYLASTGVSLRSEHLYLIAFLEVQFLVAQELGRAKRHLEVSFLSLYGEMRTRVTHHIFCVLQRAEQFAVSSESYQQSTHL